MKVNNFCRKYRKADLIAINKWARRLEAEEMIIHRDGTVTLMCHDGYICEHYQLTNAEI